MTVAELLEELARFDPSARVLLVDEGGDHVELVKVAPVFVADDGTGVFAVRDERAQLVRWMARSAPLAAIDAHPAAELTSSAWEDS